MISDKCPDDNPYLCNLNTLSMGLCVKNNKECNIRTLENRDIPILSEEGNNGEKYGYHINDLGRGCYTKYDNLQIDYIQEYTDGEEIPSNFSLLTYNIWGLAKNDNFKKLFNLRKSLLKSTIKNTNADILCLQEMSKFSYEQLDKFISKYKYASEIPYPINESNRNRSVDVYLLSKYKPVKITNYSLPGVLGYYNCMLVIEFKNLIIFNVYLQAGSRSSSGQENYWIHYSRCRNDLLNIISDMYNDKYNDKNIIICGDFNFNLDGQIEEWPEIKQINNLKSNGFIDTFKTVNPDEYGFTEDTDVNVMRWNQKLIEKKYRYDSILYKGEEYNPIISKLIGMDVKYLNKKNSSWFLKNMSEMKSVDQLKLLIKISDNKYLVPINPSDHFGVFTKFKKFEN
jgi:exonuclease III